MPDNNFRFAFDFFFTDLPNQVEFLKWTRGLGKDDDVLLAAALEAMYMHSMVEQQHDSSASSIKYKCATMKQQFWRHDFNATTTNGEESFAPAGSAEGTMQHHQAMLQRGQSVGINSNASTAPDTILNSPILDHKHPYNLIEVYANLKRLDGHEFNVIEFAYLQGGWRDFESIWDLLPRLQKPSETHIRLWTAFLSFVSQYAFSFILIFFHWSNGIEIVYDRDAGNSFTLLLIVTVISTVVFWNVAAKQWQDCLDFNGIDGNRADLYLGGVAVWVGRCLLMMNFLVNVVLGPPLVIFNIYFVLTSENPTEGILNAVALGFVLEVDDLLAPSWDNDRIEDATANLFHEYISEPFPGDDEQFSHMSFVRKPGKIPYNDGDKLYIKVPETLPNGATEFDITVFRSNTEFEGGTTPTDDYESILYKISGNEDYIGIFHERVRAFYCVQNFDDFQVQAKSMEMMSDARSSREESTRRRRR